MQPADGKRWTGRGRGACRILDNIKPGPLPGAVNMGEVIARLASCSPGAIVTNGAGNFATSHRFSTTGLDPARSRLRLDGLRAAGRVAAKLAQPKRPVVSLAGDGDFLMTGQELATAAQYGCRCGRMIIAGGLYGTIRSTRSANTRAHLGKTLANPDFAAFARGFGAHGDTVEATANFAPAFKAALASSQALRHRAQAQSRGPFAAQDADRGPRAALAKGH